MTITRIYTIVCRYGIDTFDDVQRVNSRFQHIRRLLIVELFEIEKIVPLIVHLVLASSMMANIDETCNQVSMQCHQ